MFATETNIGAIRKYPNKTFFLAEVNILLKESSPE